MKTNWKELIELAMEHVGETWEDVEAMTLTEEELTREFDSGYGAPEGCPFTVWSKKRVYFPACYSGSEWATSVARHPDGEVTYHIGG